LLLVNGEQWVSKKLVIPAKAGIHFDLALKHKQNWIPAFAGMTAKKNLDLVVQSTST